MEEDMGVGIYKPRHHKFAPEIYITLQNWGSLITGDHFCDEPGVRVYCHRDVFDEFLVL